MALAMLERPDGTLAAPSLLDARLLPGLAALLMLGVPALLAGAPSHLCVARTPAIWLHRQYSRPCCGNRWCGARRQGRRRLRWRRAGQRRWAPRRGCSRRPPSPSWGPCCCCRGGRERRARCARPPGARCSCASCGGTAAATRRPRAPLPRIWRARRQAGARPWSAPGTSAPWRSTATLAGAPSARALCRPAMTRALWARSHGSHPPRPQAGRVADAPGRRRHGAGRPGGGRAGRAAPQRRAARGGGRHAAQAGGGCGGAGGPVQPCHAGPRGGRRAGGADALLRAGGLGPGGAGEGGARAARRAPAPARRSAVRPPEWSLARVCGPGGLRQSVSVCSPVRSGDARRAAVKGAAAALLAGPMSGYSIRSCAAAGGMFGLASPLFALLALLVRPGLQGAAAAGVQPLMLHMVAAGVAGAALQTSTGVLWPVARQLQQRAASFALACGCAGAAAMMLPALVW